MRKTMALLLALGAMGAQADASVGDFTYDDGYDTIADGVGVITLRGLIGHVPRIAVANIPKGIINEKTFVDSVKTWAFADCASLEEVIFPTGVWFTLIGPNAFQNCTGLESVYLPDNVKSLMET